MSALRGTWLLAMMFACASGGLGSALACRPTDAAAPAEVRSVDARGDILLTDGRIFRLSGVPWPSSNRPKSRERLQAELTVMLVNEAVLVDAASVPDRWGRIAGNAFVLKSGAASPQWVQGQLVEDGLVPPWPEVSARSCWAQLLEREMLARDGNLGVWSGLGRRVLALRLRHDAGTGMSQRVVFEGFVRSVRKGRSVTFVNFSGPRGKTPSWFISRGILADLLRLGRDPATFVGKRIRVRAELRHQTTPRLVVSLAEAVEVLD